MRMPIGRMSAGQNLLPRFEYARKLSRKVANVALLMVAMTSAAHAMSAGCAALNADNWAGQAVSYKSVDFGSQTSIPARSSPSSSPTIRCRITRRARGPCISLGPMFTSIISAAMRRPSTSGSGARLRRHSSLPRLPAGQRRQRHGGAGRSGRRGSGPAGLVCQVHARSRVFRAATVGYRLTSPLGSTEATIVYNLGYDLPQWRRRSMLRSTASLARGRTSSHR
ncbi:hypothetical protein SAMN05428969_2060 [Devosia sp. YR412]|nr:hypothetical protein SAMN05428969_2060 [Devosia sp. YR412]